LGIGIPPILQENGISNVLNKPRLENLRKIVVSFFAKTQGDIKVLGKTL